MTGFLTQPNQLNTPVLFLVFNSPDTTARVFKTIRKAKPLRLYVASDGPREGRDGEMDQVKKTRDIATSVDWPCEVRVLFRSYNLGCKYAVSGAINWFFQYEESGIILEDDVLPAEGFFEYCQAALQKYANNPNVGIVSGHSLETKENTPNARYSTKFTTYGLIWGWATWRNIWNKYDVELADWDSKDLDFLCRKDSSNKLYVHVWRQIFINIQDRKVDSWAHQLNFLLLRHNLLCVHPPYNIIDNIGYGSDATHTSGNRPAWLVNSNKIIVDNITFTNPSINLSLDQAIGAQIFGISPWAKIKHFIKGLIRYRESQL